MNKSFGPFLRRKTEVLLWINQQHFNKVNIYMVLRKRLQILTLTKTKSEPA